MTRILITGSKGVIGSVVTKALSEKYDVIGLDLPESDIAQYDYLLGQMKDVDIVIHLALAPGENWQTDSINPTNVLLEMNVLRAVIEAKVPRLIMASSVHADNFMEYEGEELMTVPGSYHPTSPYGAHKIIVEEMGRFYASHHDLEFIGIRFGAVTKDNSVKHFGKEAEVWLSYRDLVAAIESCVAARSVPDSFALFYAVSNNTGRLHSTDNPFGWEPQDNSTEQGRRVGKRS